MQYWFGHVDRIPPITRRAQLSRGRLGPKLPKGTELALISPNHEEPHLHVGLDARALIGAELEHHTNYTHGAPTVGTQLA